MALFKSAWGVFAALIALAFVVCVAGPALFITTLILHGTGTDEAVKRRAYSRFMFCWAQPTFGIFCRLMRIRPVSMHFDNAPFPPSIVIANHQNLTDIFVLMKLLPEMGCDDARWVMKDDLARIPVIAHVCRGNVSAFIDRKDPIGSEREIRKTARVADRDGASMIIFPEGTRFVPREEGYLDPSGGPNYMHVRAPKPGGFLTIRQEMPARRIMLVTIDWGEPVSAKSFFQLGALFGRTVLIKTELYQVPDADTRWLNSRWREIENHLRVARRK